MVRSLRALQQASQLQKVLMKRAVPTAVHSYHLDKFPMDDLLAAPELGAEPPPSPAKRKRKSP